MARRKVQLAYIVNASERKASYKKRKKGLIKKVSELSTLCDVEACAIIYSPCDQAEPDVWPSRLRAQVVLNRLNNLPEVDRTRKMFNQESYTRMRIKKAEDRLARLRRENKRMMLENFLYQCAIGVASFDSFDPHDTKEMQLVISEVLQDLNSRMEAMRKVAQVPPRQPNADPPSAPPQSDADPSNSALAIVSQAPPAYQAWQPFEAGPSATPFASSLITPPPPAKMEAQNLLDSFPFNLLQCSMGHGIEFDDGMPYWTIASADATAMPPDPAPFGINNSFSETLPTYAAGSGSMDPARFVWDDHHMLPSHVDFNFANAQALPQPQPPRAPSVAARVATTIVDATITPQGQPNNNSRYN